MTALGLIRPALPLRRWRLLGRAAAGILAAGRSPKNDEKPLTTAAPLVYYLRRCNATPASERRLDLRGGVDHVWNRGLEGRAIKGDDRDRRNGLRLAGRVATRRTWRVFVWTVLDNHDHGLLRTPAGDLSEGSHDWLLGSEPFGEGCGVQ